MEFGAAPESASLVFLFAVKMKMCGNPGTWHSVTQGIFTRKHLLPFPRLDLVLVNRNSNMGLDDASVSVCTYHARPPK